MYTDTVTTHKCLKGSCHSIQEVPSGRLAFSTSGCVSSVCLATYGYAESKLLKLIMEGRWLVVCASSGFVTRYIYLITQVIACNITTDMYSNECAIYNSQYVL